MTMGEKIKLHRTRLGLSQEELGAKVNVNKAAVQKWERGTVQNIKRSNIKILAELFEISPADLMCWEEKYNKDGKLAEEVKLFEKYGLLPIETKKFPLLGEIACGEPTFADEDFESYIEAGADIKADFCLKAKGDSMINARIYDGDIVFIRTQPTVNNGEVAVVIIDDEATLKRVYYYPEQQKVVLQAENSKYEPFIYSDEELDHIRILGKVVAFQSDVK